MTHLSHPFWRWQVHLALRSLLTTTTTSGTLTGYWHRGHNLTSKGIAFHSFKDHVVLKTRGTDVGGQATVLPLQKRLKQKKVTSERAFRT
jgi:hypothetical protein